MIQEKMQQLIERKNLTEEEALTAACEIMKEADPAQTAALLVLLRAKGETSSEIAGFVRALRSEGKRLHLDRPVLDIVGTGGDQAGTVNISTGSALLAAACGIPVVKHGNRAVSSRAGSADVLEAMGYDIHQSPQKSLQKNGFSFCFAPDYHPALAKVKPIRNGLKIPTIFNLLGPLLNPAGTDYMMIGVYCPEKVKIMADALFSLGTKRSLVFHGNGIDELSCLGSIEALLVTEKGVEPLSIDPEKLGLKKCKLEDLKGGDAHTNAQILIEALSGVPSPVADTLILNAGVALFLYGPARSIEEGVKIAKQVLYGKKKSLKEAIRKNRGAILAEVKRKSPSAGEIGEIPDAAKRAALYVMGGAAAISVLTSDAFGGNLEDLQRVAKELAHVPIPILRKDFLTEPSQLKESAESGADAVLLMVSRLKERTKEMIVEARVLGLEALVEVHNQEELKIALDAGAEIIGVNQRDLSDFSMHPEVYEELIGSIPSGKIKVAESGMKSGANVEKVRSLGYDAVLIGEALTRIENPLSFLSSLRLSHVR